MALTGQQVPLIIDQHVALLTELLKQSVPPHEATMAQNQVAISGKPFDPNRRNHGHLHVSRIS
jgi:hypothetical protein